MAWRSYIGPLVFLLAIQWRTRKMTKGQAMIFKTLHIYNQDWATRTPLKTFKILINITICIRCEVQPIDRRIVLFLSRWFWINISTIIKKHLQIHERKKGRKQIKDSFYFDVPGTNISLPYLCMFATQLSNVCIH